MAEETTQDYTFKYVSYDIISDMLYGDDDYILEFAEAAIQSFEEFSDHYKQYLLAKEETPFRKAGHKIKPIAQMIGVSVIVDEYEHGKKLIHEDADSKKLKASSKKIEHIVEEVIEDLEMVCHKSK